MVSKFSTKNRWNLPFFWSLSTVLTYGVICDRIGTDCFQVRVCLPQSPFSSTTLYNFGGTLQYTHANRSLLYARTSFIRFCSQYVFSSFVIFLELALIDSLVF